MTTRKGEKGPKAPFPLHGHYPTAFEQWRYDIYNSIFNQLYPVRPWLFTTTLAASGLYFKRRADEGGASLALQFIGQLPLLRSLGAGAQIAVASLAASYLPVLLLRSLLRYYVFCNKEPIFDNRKNPCLKSKIWIACWAVLQKLAPPRLETCNSLLPKMPVPPLQKTVDGYLASMEPILPKNEYETLREMADQFLHHEGKKLQFYTQFYSWFTSNYVTSFWERYVYLSGRETLLINSSVGNVDICRPSCALQAQRAAHMAYLTALNMLAFGSQSIQPPGQGIVYSGHYRRLFANTRIPGKYCDQWCAKRYARHLAVYANGCFYKLDLFHPQTNSLYSVDELTELFSELLCRRDDASDGERKIAALTHDKRDAWHENRRRFFLNHPVNDRALKMIEDAMAVYIMDDQEYDFQLEKPHLLDHYSTEMLAGNGANRWVDKVLNFVVSRNGRIGGTSEHSVADGAEFAHIMENCLYVDRNFLKYPDSGVANDAIIPRAPNGSTSNDVLSTELLLNGKSANCSVRNGSCSAVEQKQKLIKHSTPKFAERIQFDISPAMEAEINRCYREYQQFKSDLDIVSLVFGEFGNLLIKSGKCTPDAFVQMAIQLANFRDQGRFVLTYEATSARFYQNSRTETLRSVSRDSCAFVRAMLNANSNDAERLRLLRHACNTHYMNNRKAMTGGGIDRHLFVLYVMSRATNTSSPFLKHYVSQKWLLSTSQPPTMTKQLDENSNRDWAWLGANFGAVASNGYGICYRFMGDHSICFHISSYHSAENTSSSKFRALLAQSLRELGALFNAERANA